MSLKQLAQEATSKLVIHYVALDSLVETFLTGNSKKHNIPMLIDSIQRHGFKDPIAFDSKLNNGKGGIIEGNGRLEAAIKMRSQGMNPPKYVTNNWEIPVIFGDAVSEKEAISYSIEHNWSVTWGSEISLEQKLSMFEESDLKAQFHELDEADSLPISFIDDLDELRGIFDEDDDSGNGFGDGKEEPELPTVEPEEPIVKRGQVWKLGRHKLACINSTNEKEVRDFLGNNSPDMVWADPPYGISIVAGNKVGGDKSFGSVGGGKIVKSNTYQKIIGDDSVNTAVKSFQLAFEIGKKALHVWWGGNYYANELPNSSCWIIWDKNNTGNFADAEVAWTNSNTAIRLFKHTWNGLIKDSERGESRVHPTQKPIALFIWVCERYGKEDDFIFDPFLGSGISIIGCQQMSGNRVTYGCELSEHYCDVIIARYEALTGEKAVLERVIEYSDEDSKA